MLENLRMTDLIAAGAVFGLLVAVAFLLAILVHMRHLKRDETLRRRLDIPEAGGKGTRVLRLWQGGREQTTVVPSESKRASLGERLDRFRRDAGWDVPAPTLVMGFLGVTGLAYVVAYVLTESILLAAVAGATAAMVLSFYTRWRIQRQAALFERQLVDALELAARSLRAGHPLLGAFQLIAEDLEDPVRTVFADICQQQEMGIGLQVALAEASLRTNSPDMRVFATSVAIQLRSGGNLADMMDRVAFVVRERIRLARRVRVLTAQTQFSKRVLLLLPVLLFLTLRIIRPEYMGVLQNTPAGRILMAVAAGGMLVGAYAMNRMARIAW